MRNRFFSSFDWAAFWLATLVSFGVYFYTLGPSVGLEDSGELATAAAHLGVPHAPGYPFWTFCSWIFCKVFSGVTYMGHPTPAWAVSLCSAVFGAFAAGCTAMLICRSAQDFLAVRARQDATGGWERHVPWLCFAGGVGGALTFAFSPVEWSQSTIVEIYSLGSLFLMLVLLLSYRWMRRPSDRVLWTTAFVFGLGLTNYQVLLFALVPLAMVIAFRNIALFRDFAIFMIPVLLTYQILQVGDLSRAQHGMTKDVIAKQAPVGVAADELAVSLLHPWYRMRVDDPSRFEGAREYIRRQIPELERQRIEASRRLEDGLRKAEAARAALKDAERLAKSGKVNGDVVEAARAKASAEAESVRSLKNALEEAERTVASERRLCNEVLPTVDRRVKALGAKARAMLLSDNPHPPVAHTSHNPSGIGAFLSLALFVGALAASLAFRRRRPDISAYAAAGGGLMGVAGLFLSATLFSSEATWDMASSHFLTAPLVDPFVYVGVGIFSVASVAFSVAWLRMPVDMLVAGRPARRIAFIASIVSAVAAVAVAYLFVPSSDGLSTLFGYCGEAYPWGKSTVVFLALVVALFALSSFIKGGLAFAIPVAGFHLAVFILLRNGAMNGLVHPASWWFWWPLAWNFVVLALAWHVLPNGRSVAGAAFFTQLGVAFYAYMPIVSDLRNPPMNWAYPRTWDGFKHAITRGQYESIQAESFDSFSGFVQNFMQKLEYYFDDVKLQFTDFLVLLATVPFACWRVAVRTRRGAFSLRALWVVGGVLGVLLLRDIFGSGEADADSAWLRFDRVLVVALAAFALAGILVIGARQFIMRPVVAIRRFMEVNLAAGRRQPLIAFAVLASELVVVPVVLALGFGGGTLAAIAGIMVCASAAALVVSVRPILRFVRGMRSEGGDVSFEARDVTQQWLLASGACFLMMSVLLIVLAKVQGDIQDNFIQKVKFIMSHAMIALWIGYGLAFTAALVVRFVPVRHRRRVVAALVPFVVVAAAWQPLAQNYTNDKLVFELGGAEQNDHTFGWQFGAYQLDGAKAIRAQMEADEEPLPDPDWPPEMEDHAVFFGGTDPGRFVPTYMIYSAEYRPDVYLITQNALADLTYMSVERDLYGDEIWIPANEDNAKAFEDFVNSLSEEERAAYGVSTENGRVQVTGALSVMKINDRLTKVMFDKNSPRHAFYVEESYPIDWMYDYLTPHGLIMKIEPGKTNGTATDGRWRDLLRRDRDFWDWYTRRLLDDPMFRRDFAAQKSFAKLRSAISGLALNRLFRARSIASSEAFRGAAEQGFREACLLAPISPESTLRYIQTHLINRGASEAESESSLNVIEELLDYIDQKDPRNVRTKNHRRTIANWRELISFRRDLSDMESRFSDMLHDSKAPGEEARELAWKIITAYAGLADINSAEGAAQSAAQCMRRAVTYVRGVLPETIDPEKIALAAEILVAAHQDDAAEKAVTQYGRVTGDPKLQKLPARLWIVLAKVYSRRGASSKKYLKGSVDWLKSRHASAWAGAVASDPEVGAIDRAVNGKSDGHAYGGVGSTQK